MSYKRIVAPTTEPLTRNEVKQHLRIDLENMDDNDTIDRLIIAARERAENYTGRALMAQQWALWLDYFTVTIDLPIAPLLSVESIQYVDSDGILQTLDNSKYRVLSSGLLGKIEPEYNECWPSTRHISEAIQIAFTAGYTVVPETIKQAMLLMIGSWDRNTENTAPVQLYKIPDNAEYLLDPYRIFNQ